MPQKIPGSGAEPLGCRNDSPLPRHGTTANLLRAPFHNAFEEIAPKCSLDQAASPISAVHFHMDLSRRENGNRAARIFDATPAGIPAQASYHFGEAVSSIAYEQGASASGRQSEPA